MPEQETDHAPQCVMSDCEGLADGISDMCGPCAELFAREWQRTEWVG